MYNSYQIPGNFNNGVYRPTSSSSSDRLIGGGFFGPFLLGGITGGLLAPAFGPRPFYPAYQPYPPYYYGPYYR